MAVATKTLTPTGQVVSLPDMTEKPNASVLVDGIGKSADAINALNTNHGKINSVSSGAGIVDLDELFASIKTFTNNMNNGDVKTAGFGASSSADSTIFTQGGQYAGHISKYASGNWTGFFTNNVGETIAVGTYNNGDAKWHTSSREINSKLTKFRTEEVTTDSTGRVYIAKEPYKILSVAVNDANYWCYKRYLYDNAPRTLLYVREVDSFTSVPNTTLSISYSYVE